MHFILSNNDPSVLSNLPQQERKHVMQLSSHSGIVDVPEHLRIFVPADTELQRNSLRSYHDSPTATHRGRDATLGLPNIFRTG